MIIKPTIRSNDPPFVRDLKQTVTGLIEQVSAQNVVGDNATVIIGEKAGRRIVRAVRFVFFAQVTESQGDGTYEAEEVYWDDGTSAFVSLSTGRTWDATNGYLYERNLTKLPISATNGIQPIVEVYRTKGGQWVFDATPDMCIGTAVVSGLTVSSGAVTATVTTLNNQSLASQSVTILNASNGDVIPASTTVICVYRNGSWVAEEPFNGTADYWGNLGAAPEYVLAKDEDGNIGWKATTSCT